MEQAYDEEDEVIYDKTSLLQRGQRRRPKTAADARKQRDHCIRLFSLILLFACLGVSLAIPGPTLRCFEHLTGMDEQWVSCLFVGRAGGLLVASLLTQLLLDIVPADCLAVTGLLLLSAANFLIPWSERVWWLVGAFTFQGGTIGLVLSGALALTRILYGNRHLAYRHVFLLALAVGSVLTPFIVMPFQVNSDSGPSHALASPRVPGLTSPPAGPPLDRPRRDVGSHISPRKNAGLEPSPTLEISISVAATAPTARPPGGPRAAWNSPPAGGTFGASGETSPASSSSSSTPATTGKAVASSSVSSTATAVTSSPPSSPETSSSSTTASSPDTAPSSTSSTSSTQSSTSSTSSTQSSTSSTSSTQSSTSTSSSTQSSTEFTTGAFTSSSASPTTSAASSTESSTSSTPFPFFPHGGGKVGSPGTSSSTSSTSSKGSPTSTDSSTSSTSAASSTGSSTSSTESFMSSTSSTGSSTSSTSSTRSSTSSTSFSSSTGSSTSSAESSTSSAPSTESSTSSATSSTPSTSSTSSTPLPTLPHGGERVGFPSSSSPSPSPAPTAPGPLAARLTPVHRVYLTVGALTLVVCFASLHLCCACRRVPRQTGSAAGATGASAVAIESPTLFGRRRFTSTDLVFLGALLLLFCAAFGLEVTLGNYLYSWAHQEQVMSALDSLLLTAAFWAGLALGRLPPLAAARCAHSAVFLLLAHLSVGFAALLLVPILIPPHFPALWPCVALAGFGLGPFRGCMAQWLEWGFSPAEQRWLSVLTLVAGGAGEAVLPLATAFVHQVGHQPRALWFLSLGAAALCPLLFALVAVMLMQRLKARRRPQRLQEEEEDEDSLLAQPHRVMIGGGADSDDPEDGTFALRKLHNGAARPGRPGTEEGRGPRPRAQHAQSQSQQQLLPLGDDDDELDLH